LAATLSTFSIDVDGGSYANCRRYINSGYLPPVDAIRTEEFINYFQYNYGEPDDGLPFFHNAEVAACPWTEGHKILRIGF
jgi:Ca-activated chloride channel family protein